MDYSHPKYYFIISIIGVLLSIITGLTISRGFYFGVLGMGIFPMIYFLYKENYLRDERALIFEFALSVCGFIFLPLGFFFGIYNSIVPTTIDLVFFVIGVGAMTITTSLLYLIEPENEKQLIVILTISSFLLFVIILLIKFYTIGGYLGGTI